MITTADSTPDLCIKNVQIALQCLWVLGAYCTPYASSSESLQVLWASVHCKLTAGEYRRVYVERETKSVNGSFRNNSVLSMSLMFLDMTKTMQKPLQH